MAKDSGSLYVPAETPTQPEPRRYDILARNAGWTKEKLRKCYEIPRKLPSHVRHIKMTSEVLQDPFKNTPVKDPEAEYSALETKFYNRLRNMQIFQKCRVKKSPPSNETTRQPETTRQVTTTTIKQKDPDESERPRE